MRCSFTKRDVVFFLEGRGEGRKHEERGGSHSNISHSCSVWIKVERGGRCIVPEIQALTHHRLLPVCVFPGHSQSDLWLLKAQTKIFPRGRFDFKKERIIDILRLVHLYSIPIAQDLHMLEKGLQCSLLSLFHLVALISSLILFVCFFFAAYVL